MSISIYLNVLEVYVKFYRTIVSYVTEGVVFNPLPLGDVCVAGIVKRSSSNFVHS